MLVNPQRIYSAFSLPYKKFALFKLLISNLEKFLLFCPRKDEARLGALQGQRFKKMVIF